MAYTIEHDEESLTYKLLLTMTFSLHAQLILMKMSSKVKFAS